MEPPELFFQVLQVRRLISLGAADVFVSAHILNDSYIIPDVNTLCRIAFYLSGLHQVVEVMPDGQELMLDAQFAFTLLLTVFDVTHRSA
jgi:hypothetical protein